MTQNVAEAMVASLKANGVKRVYGIPGDSLNGFTDALRKDGSITWAHVRHEEVAAFAAAAEAELTGELAVCAGSCGPGNLHLINGLFDATRTRVPVLAIAAQIPSQEIGSNYFQETHPESLMADACVYTTLVSDPSQMPRAMEIAMRTAIEKKGAALIAIPGDVALKEALNTRTPVIKQTNPIVVPNDDELAEAAELLNSAKKVTILAGAGSKGAHDEVVALADALGAPIVHAFRGKEWMEYDNPFDVGMTGLLGFASGYRAMDACDTLLMLGTDFPYQQFYPDNAKTIQVDIRGDQLGRRHPLDLGLVGTVRDTAAALLKLVEHKKNRAHLKDSLTHYKKTREKLNELATDKRKSGPIHPQYVARIIDELADDDAVFTADVGSPVVWLARHITVNGKRRILGSFNHGSMANAIPQGIGAQWSHPGRQVITLSGDGGLTMLMGDLVTLTHAQLPVKIMVFNNSSLNFVELEMKAAGFVNYGTDLINPNFADMANAMGIFGQKVDNPGQVKDAVAAALSYDGPALIDFSTERQELSMPPAVKMEQMKGFALYAIRTVMSGRGDELLDLASANWRQLF